MRSLLFVLTILSNCVASSVFTRAFPVAPSLGKQHQSPMMEPGLGPALPGTDNPPNNDGDNTSDGVIISDVLGRDRSISIFASLARDVDSVAQRLQNGGLNATVLAPTNAEIAKLPRKPWEDAQDYETFGTEAYSGADGEGRAARNLKKFVEAHIVPSSPWTHGNKIQAMAGNIIWFEESNGKKMMYPDKIDVSSIADKVSNGEVWILKGVLNYAQ